MFTSCREDCNQTCDDSSCRDGCLDGCEDDLDECARWWQRACEELCHDELGDCEIEAGDGYTESAQYWEDKVDCARAYYDDCIPACYGVDDDS